MSNARGQDWGSLALDAALMGGSLAVLALSAVFRPEAWPSLPLCAFKSVTGLPCPGCGMTHAFCAIGHGEFLRAWQFNPFAFLFYLATLALLVWPFLRRRQPGLERWLVTSRLFTLVPICLVLAMWVFGIVRIVQALRVMSAAP